MPTFPLSPAGQLGIIRDVYPTELPPNAWSSGENVHFRNGYAERMLGHTDIWGGASIVPYFIVPARTLTGDEYWIYAGETQVYAYEAKGAAAGSHFNITRALGPYTSQLGEWQGGMMNGVPILNNGIDVPQMWLPVGEPNLLTALTAWPAATTTKIIRSFKNFLIALDVTKAGVRDPRLVKWSHGAAAGSVPSSWDETDPTLDAGEYSLADTEGILIDCLPMRDINVLYKDDSIWGMQLSGTSSIFRFYPIFKHVGALGKNCIAEYAPGKHLVLAKNMLYTHDGQTINQIGAGKVEDWLFGQMDKAHANRSFIVLNKAHHEAWICYPSAHQSWSDRALVWNWLSGEFGHRTLPSTASAAVGVITLTSVNDQWNSDTLPWSTPGDWLFDSVTVDSERVVIASISDSKLYGVFEDSWDAAGVAVSASLERTGLGLAVRANQPPDTSVVKFCTGLYPRFTGTAGTVVQVRFGTQMNVNDTPTWGAWQDFTIGTTQKLDVLASGRLFALGIQSSSAAPWRLHGVDVEAKQLGRF